MTAEPITPAGRALRCDSCGAKIDGHDAAKIERQAVASWLASEEGVAMVANMLHGRRMSQGLWTYHGNYFDSKRPGYRADSAPWPGDSCDRCDDDAAALCAALREAMEAE